MKRPLIFITKMQKRGELLFYFPSWRWAAKDRWKTISSSYNILSSPWIYCPGLNWRCGKKARRGASNGFADLASCRQWLGPKRYQTWDRIMWRLDDNNVISIPFRLNMEIRAGFLTPVWAVSLIGFINVVQWNQFCCSAFLGWEK